MSKSVPLIAAPGSDHRLLPRCSASVGLQFPWSLHGSRFGPEVPWLRLARLCAGAWKRRKYSNNWLEPWGEFWIFALWAAREGDFTAFRLTAERAALGKTWEQQQLAGLVAGNPPDMLEFLRRNIDSMKFDAESRRWFVPTG